MSEISRRSLIAGAAGAAILGDFTAEAQQPVVPLERAALASGTFDGPLGARILANRRNSLNVTPLANPAMVTMFDHRINPRPGAPYLPWSGEFAGKYLISAVQDLRLSHDAHLERTVADVANALIGYQEADGYLGPFDGAERIFGENWDVWGQYHCVLGLFEWFRYKRQASALVACRKAADLLATRLGPSGAVESLKAPAMNFAFAHVAALLYQEVRDPRYLDLVRAFERGWTSVPDWANFVTALQTPRSLYSVWGGGARWERLHSLQALGELHRITGDKRYLQAFVNAWQGIRQFDRHSTGGFSAIERATGNPFDPRPIETCATVAWMALSVDMLRLTGLPVAADELELSTWNATLGSQSPDGRWWTYDTPMRGIPTTGMGVMDLFHPLHRVPSFDDSRHPAVYDLGFQDRAGASYLSCCAANGPRGLGVLSEWALMSAPDGVAVNFYGPSRLTTRLPSGNSLTVEQNTTYPLTGSVELRITMTASEDLALRLRIPAWSVSTTVAVNGIPSGTATPGTYHVLRRIWKTGDKVSLTLDMRPRTWVGAPPPAGCDPGSGAGASGWIAVYRGPIQLAYDERYDRFRTNAVPAVSSSPQFTVVAAQHNQLLRVRTTTSAGDLYLSDFAAAGLPTSAPVLNPQVDGRVFQLARQGGPILAQRVRLLPDGMLQGYSHPNEARWGWADGLLTFFDQAGVPSTRFAWHARENGRTVLRGRFQFDGTIVHELREVDLQPAGAWFQFSRADGTILAERLRLMADGTIGGYSHPNERRWEGEGDTLVFRDDSGRVTTRFTDTRTTFGRTDYIGQALLDPAITHRLRRLDLEVTGKVWQFRVPHPGFVSIRLLPDGSVESDHPNESFWGWEQDQLVLYNNARTPTTRLRVGKDSDGRMTWTGPFLPNPAITHQLVEWNIDATWGQPSRYISWLRV
jgi:uncharacterized protein